MRAHISGLKQTENNVRDGISLVQTADGAMQEIHDMLNRLAALSAKSANGSLSEEEREQIQAEVDALLEEIARIKDTTEFNGIPLLQGEDATKDMPPVIKGGLPGWVGKDYTTDPTTNKTILSTQSPYETTTQYTATITLKSTVGSTTTTTTRTVSGSIAVKHAAARLDFSSFSGTADQIKDLTSSDTGFYTTCCTCDNHYSIKFVAGSTSKRISSGDHYIYEVVLTASPTVPIWSIASLLPPITENL